MGSFGRKLALVLTVMVMTLGISSTAFGADFPGVGGNGGNATPSTGCVSPDGDNGTAYDGTLIGIDASNGFVNVEFWIRGTNGQADSPEYDTVLSGGMFGNTYQPLVAKIWTYPASICTAEQVTDLVNKHVAARQASGANNAGLVVWAEDPDVQALFPRTSTTTTPAGDTNPDMTGVVVNTNPDCSDTAAQALATSQGVPMANRDYCNQLANPSLWCGSFNEYDLNKHPELATAASYLVIKVTNLKGGDRVAILPHGRYGTDVTLKGNASEFGVYCTYEQVLSWAQQTYPSTQIVDWDQISPIGLVTYQGDYRGGTVDPDTNVACHAIKHKDLFEQLNGHIQIPNGVTWIAAQPWKDGTPEIETIFDVTNAKSIDYDAGVKGSIWYFAGNCDHQFMVANAKASHFSRAGQHADNQEFVTVMNWDGPKSSIRTWFHINP